MQICKEIFSRESDSTTTNVRSFVRLSVCLSVCPSETKTPKQLKIIHFTLPQHSTPLTPLHISQHNITLNITKQSHTLSQPSTILILNTPSPTPTHAPSHTTSRHHSYHQHQCYNQPLHHHRLLISRLLSFSACFCFYWQHIHQIITKFKK